jgi:hypothetical protein
MTRPYKDEAVRISAASRVRPSGPRSSRTGSRWSLWLCSIFAAAGAAIMVNVAGTGGSGANVPAVIQVGGQAAVIPSGVAKSTSPKSNAGSTTNTTTNTSTTTTTSITRHTTVIKPLSPITDQEESKGYGNSSSDDQSGGDDHPGGANVGTTTSTTATIPSTSTTSTTLSTSVDN